MILAAIGGAEMLIGRELIARRAENSQQLLREGGGPCLSGGGRRADPLIDAGRGRPPGRVAVGRVGLADRTAIAAGGVREGLLGLGCDVPPEGLAVPCVSPARKASVRKQ